MIDASAVRLSGDRYAERAAAGPGQAFALTEPVAVTVRPEDLLPAR